MREIGDGFGRVERLEATVTSLLQRIDNLEAAVVALCEQDGEVTYERIDDGTR
jgi:hypothetical protein